MEDLKKRKRQYGWGAVILAFAVYGIGNVSDLIVSQGGTDNISATILVWLNAIFSLGVLFCIVMWFSDWQQMRKMSGIGGEQRKPRNTQPILIKTAAVIAIIAGLVFIFDKIEIHPLSLFSTKESCAEKMLSEYAKELLPNTVLADYVSEGSLLFAEPKIVFLSGMNRGDLVALARQAPQTKINTIISFPINTHDQNIIGRIVESGRCDVPPFICFKDSSCYVGK